MGCPRHRWLEGSWLKQRCFSQAVFPCARDGEGYSGGRRVTREIEMFDFVVINTTRILSGEQMRVLRNVAAMQLRKRQENPLSYFEHQYCEGSVTRKDEGVLGTFAGTIFCADLGVRDGERWTVEFLIPRNTEWGMVEEGIRIMSGRPLPDNDYGVKEVDTSKTESIKAWQK